jgi:hypothetical protein
VTVVDNGSVSNQILPREVYRGKLRRRDVSVLTEKLRLGTLMGKRMSIVTTNNTYYIPPSYNSGTWYCQEDNNIMLFPSKVVIIQPKASFHVSKDTFQNISKMFDRVYYSDVK